MSAKGGFPAAWSAPRWTGIGPLTVTGPITQSIGDMITIPTGAGVLTLTFHSFGMRLRSTAQPHRAYGMLAGEPDILPCEIDAGSDKTVLTAGDFVLKLEHQPLAFSLTRSGRVVQNSPSDGHFVRRFRLPPFALTPEGWFVALDLGSSDPVYGLGEKWGRLDHRGQLIRSSVEDALGVNAEQSYKNVPFAWSPAGWGVLVHTPAPVVHSVGFAPWSQRAYGLLIEDQELDLFLIAGDNGAEIIRHYIGLTGAAPVPPLWSLGVILSKAYYRTAEEILAVAAEVRRRDMPCDVITFDGRAWQDTETRFAFEWDPVRYPDPGAVIRQLKAMNFRICVWEYPLVSVNNPLFARMSEKGWLLKDRLTGEAYRYRWDMEPFGAVLTPLPDSGIVDFTHPDAYAFWRDAHKDLFALGVDMIKADFGEQVPDDVIASNGETGHALHNVYVHLYNRCVYEACERYSQSGPFLFSRSGWIGAQRYPAQWGGDPQADWGGLSASLRGGLSWGLSGGPFYATDVGGFYRDQRDPALYVRWCQAAVFSAHMRLHGIGPREPWSYGPEAEAAAMDALRLRYRLLPYLVSTMNEAHLTGLPVQRAMVLACPEDRAAWSFEDQFFFGAEMIVAPCLRPDGKVEFYLPKGIWMRFPSNEAFEGGQSYRLTLELSEIAVFVRNGVQIPLGPPVLHTGQLVEQPEIAGYWRAGR
jgi:alpha-D-xyloside xylohydrolase